MKALSRFYGQLSSEERSTLQRQLAAVFIVVTLLNLGFYWQRAFREAAARRNLHSVVRGWDGLAWYVWMPAAPATLLLIRRHPFQRERAARSLARLAAGSAVIYFVVTNTRYLLRITPNLWLPPEQDLPVNWLNYLQTQLERTPLDFLTYCGLFATSFAVHTSSQSRQRSDELMRLQLRTARLESELARLQLTALRGQLHPHFLFNSFNAIATLVRQRKTDEAAEMLAQLSELLRTVMENIELQERTLLHEIEFVRSYLGIERIRFGEKLRTTFAIEPGTLECLVPNLLLQPLVENAIKHGISRRLEPGEVCIAARRQGSRLQLEIANDGAEGVDSAASTTAGIGLRNTVSRLELAYGSDYQFELITRPAGGASVRLDLPWKPATAGASAIACAL
jgi:hypothetical protein